MDQRKITTGVLAGVGIASIVAAYLYYKRTDKNEDDDDIYQDHNDETKTLYLLKQGEAQHNVRGKGQRVLNNDIHDPLLTKKGIKLAQKCVIPFELYDLQPPDVVILCSPLRRSLQTCLFIFGDYCRARKIKIKVWDLLQGGRSDQPCLIGSSPGSLKKAFREYLDILDFSDVETNQGYTSSERKLVRKPVMDELRDRLAKLYAKTIIISAHTYTLCGIAEAKKMKLKYARLQRWDLDLETKKVNRWEG